MINKYLKLYNNALIKKSNTKEMLVNQGSSGSKEDGKEERKNLAKV